MRRLTRLILAASVCLPAPLLADADDNGVRMPTLSASHVMIEVGDRYQNLYWAAKLGQWEFAQYQVEELTKLIERLRDGAPTFAAGSETFLERGLDGYPEAIAQRDWPRFQQAFGQMRSECITCHGRYDHGFIVPPEAPATATSPILDLPR